MHLRMRLRLMTISRTAMTTRQSANGLVSHQIISIQISSIRYGTRHVWSCECQQIHTQTMWKRGSRRKSGVFRTKKSGRLIGRKCESHDVMPLTTCLSMKNSAMLLMEPSLDFTKFLTDMHESLSTRIALKPTPSCQTQNQSLNQITITMRMRMRKRLLSLLVL